MPFSVATDRYVLTFGLLSVFLAVWTVGCGSLLPDVVYRSPLVRVYPVDDPSAPPLATEDRYLSGEDLAPVDLDTVRVDVFSRTDRIRPHQQMAVLHLLVSESMYAVSTNEKSEEMCALLRKAAARLGGDAVVWLRTEARREDETPPHTQTAGVRGNAWPGSADRSKEEWQDDWREARTVSVRAAVVKYSEDA